MFFSRPPHTVKTTTKAINYTIFHPHISIFKGHVSTPTDHPLHFHTYPDKPIECSGAKECVGEYFGDGVDSQIYTSPTTRSSVSTYYTNLNPLICMTIHISLHTIYIVYITEMIEDVSCALNTMAMLYNRGMWKMIND